MTRCPRCRGTGVVRILMPVPDVVPLDPFPINAAEPITDRVRCDECNGKGYVEKEKGHDLS